MSTSTDALLVYGYEIPEDLELDWLDEDAEDLADELEKRLLAQIAGFTETYPGADGDGGAFYDRKREAEKRLGVEIVIHCHIDAPMYVLAGTVITAHRGYPATVDPTVLLDVDEMNTKLTAALAALNWTPTQERPAWLLCSYWG